MATKEWLSNQQLAQRYDVSLDTVRRWRLHGDGPAGIRVGRHVRYALEDVEAWEDERRQAEQARRPSREAS